ncbi:MAG: hypothetical protein QOI59_1749, partial [Gammaproteobacteria bacterium]|nr:hypothetical protein [Gammaproteobacteria bacterium]
MTFVHPAKQSILNSMSRLLGIPAQNLIWTYLNEGNHEEADRDDFDAAHVETVPALRVFERSNARPLDHVAARYSGRSRAVLAPSATGWPRADDSGFGSRYRILLAPFVAGFVGP